MPRRKPVKVSDIEDEMVAAINIPITDIERNPLNPRGTVKPDDVIELTNSIKVHGVMQPIVVDLEWNIIAGERRYVAAKAAGLKEIPVIFRDIQSDREMRELALTENVQREDLKPVTEAKAYADLMERGLTVDEITERTGIRRDKIYRMLRLLKLPLDVQEAVENQTLSIEAAITLLQVEGADTQSAIASKAVNEGLTTEAVRQEIGLKPHRGKATTKTLQERRAIIVNHAIDRIEAAKNMLDPLDGFDGIVATLGRVHQTIIDILMADNKAARPKGKNGTKPSEVYATSALSSPQAEPSDEDEYLFEAGWSKRGSLWRDPKDHTKTYTQQKALELQAERGIRVEVNA